jgi:hypothetical protein
MLGAILAAPPERQGEGLGGEVVGQVGTDPPPQVAQDRRVWRSNSSAKRAGSTSEAAISSVSSVGAPQDAGLSPSQ